MLRSLVTDAQGSTEKEKNMDLIQAAAEGTLKIDNSAVYITREVQNLQACASKVARYGLTGVKWSGEKNYAWASEGHVLVLRPMGYPYEGQDWNLDFSGPAMGPGDFFAIDSNSRIFDIF
mgnify:CR=1 FL=1